MMMMMMMTNEREKEEERQRRGERRLRRTTGGLQDRKYRQRHPGSLKCRQHRNQIHRRRSVSHTGRHNGWRHPCHVRYDRRGVLCRTELPVEVRRCYPPGARNAASACCNARCAMLGCLALQLDRGAVFFGQLGITSRKCLPR